MTRARPTPNSEIAAHPRVAIYRLRRAPDARVAARVLAMHVAVVVLKSARNPKTDLAPGPAGLLDLLLVSGVVELEVDGGMIRSLRPWRGRCSENDVVFASAGFASVFDLDWFAVESWVWTGRSMLPSEVAAAPSAPSPKR